MSQYLYLLFAPLLASFCCYVAYDYFATLSLHGIISGDLLFLLLVYALPQKSKFKILLLLGSIATIFFFNPIVGVYALLVTGVSSIQRESKWWTILSVALFVLFSVLADCVVFFRETFMMNLPQLWGVCTFFWWGTVLFFFVPLGYVIIIVWFLRKILWGRERITLKTWIAFSIYILVLLASAGFGEIQKRMSLLEFPVYRCFQNYNIHKPFEGVQFSKAVVKGDSLDENTKKIFEIWTAQNNAMIRNKAVFVLVESYGVSKDTSIAKRMIFNPFRKANISFAGILSRQSAHTQGAELDDLGNVDFRDTSEIPFISLLKQQHIESWYVHGYNGLFYSRSEKYKQLGFDSLLFVDDLKARGAQMCHYGFEGVCDSSMVNIIDSILQRAGDKFVFWTTLDSHPPFEKNLALPSYSIFCKNLTVSEKECMYFSLIENTLKNIVRLAQKYPDYQFVIRGDHRPMGTIDPDKFYYAWVPMIILN